MLYVIVFLCKFNLFFVYLLFGDCCDIVFILVILVLINDIIFIFRNYIMFIVIYFKVYIFEWNIDEI